MQPSEPASVEQFESLLLGLGLTFERLSLKKNPNGIHWHIRMPNKKGTLEANWNPKTGMIWVDVRPNRSAEWQRPIIDLLESEIQNYQSRTFLSEEL